MKRTNDADAAKPGDCRCYYRHGILGGDSTMSRHAVKGFTLIELMVVLAIVAIIAAIAIPSYAAQVRKSRRADATSTRWEMPNSGKSAGVPKIQRLARWPRQASRLLHLADITPSQWPP